MLIEQVLPERFSGNVLQAHAHEVAAVEWIGAENLGEFFVGEHALDLARALLENLALAVAFSFEPWRLHGLENNALGEHRAIADYAPDRAADLLLQSGVERAVFAGVARAEGEEAHAQAPHKDLLGRGVTLDCKQSFVRAGEK